MTRSRQTLQCSFASGFTLVELLIAVSIILILTVITASAIRVTIDGDKVRGAARQVQSMLEGARNRAAHAREPRGVRFLLSAEDQGGSNSRTVDGMVFIAPSDPWSDGSRVRIERFDESGGPMGFPDGTIAGVDNYRMLVRLHPNYFTDQWRYLFNRGVLVDGVKIRIPAVTGILYEVERVLGPIPVAMGVRYFQNGLIDNDHADLGLPAFMAISGATPDPRLQPLLVLRTPFQNDGKASGDNEVIYHEGPLTYELLFPPRPLVGEEVVKFPKGAVIHLDRCTNRLDFIETSAAAQTASSLVRGQSLPPSWRRAILSDRFIVGSPDEAVLKSERDHQSGFAYTNYLDILFSPRGVVVGDAASAPIHLYIADRKDVDRDQQDWLTTPRTPPMPPTPPPPLSLVVPEFGTRAADGEERGDKIVVSIFPRTGSVTVNPLFDTVGGGLPVSQRFRYSELGEIAGR